MFSLSLFVVSGRRNNQNEKVTKLFPFLVKIFKKKNQCLLASLLFSLFNRQLQEESERNASQIKSERTVGN